MHSHERLLVIIIYIILDSSTDNIIQNLQLVLRL